MNEFMSPIALETLGIIEGCSGGPGAIWHPLQRKIQYRPAVVLDPLIDGRLEELLLYSK